MPVSVVAWQGESVVSVETGFASAVQRAGLDEAASPHTLRNTAATSLMPRGIDVWKAADFPGTTVKVLEGVSGHQHPTPGVRPRMPSRIGGANLFRWSKLWLSKTRPGTPYSNPSRFCSRLSRRWSWWARQDSNLQPDRYERPTST